MSAPAPASYVVEAGNVKPFFTGQPPSAYSDIVLDEANNIFIPAAMAMWLREYQIQGVQFLYNAYKNKTGVILGDDMGLGKTAQCIVFLNAIFGKSGAKNDARLMRDRRDADLPYPKALVVCPKTLISNWQNEFSTWSFTHAKHYSGKDREATLEQAAQGRLEVMLITYEAYRSDADRINLIPWDVVIADEFHCIKNLNSALHKAFKTMEIPCRIGLSGTPFQNKYLEFYALFSWLRPDSCGSAADWEKRFTAPILNGRKQDSSNADIAKGQIATRNFQKITDMIMLRRLKTIIADQLPKKTDLILFCPLTPLQSEVYNRIAESEDVQRLCKKLIEYEKKYNDQDLTSTDADQNRRLGETDDKFDPKQIMLRYISVMRVIPHHLALLLPSSEDSESRRETKERLLDIALPGRWRSIAARGANINDRDETFCGKWKTLQKMLRLWYTAGSNKVLIFSSSVKLLDMLESLLQTERYTFEVLNGRLSAEERRVAVDNFNNIPERFIFLISTGAGAVGLNITSANKCVIFNPDWNPSKDLQAQDRAYRIGQRRDVEVYRLIAVGTIEELIYARQVYKQQQADVIYNKSHQRRYFKGVMGDKHQHGELFGLTNLLTYHGTNHITRDIFKRTSIAERKFDIDVELASIEVPILSNDGGEAAGEDEEAELAVYMDEDGLPKASTASTLDILATDGIGYVQDNAEALGNSELVQRMEVRAAARAQDPSLADCRADGVDDKKETSGSVRVGVIPREVSHRHFLALASFNGSDNASQFATTVMQMSYPEKRKMLDDFYAYQRKVRR
jgi:SNF2 family DNA or RNA helicase